MEETSKFSVLTHGKTDMISTRKSGLSPRNSRSLKKQLREKPSYITADLFNIKVDPDEILKEVLLEESAKVNFDSLSGGQKQKTGLPFRWLTHLNYSSLTNQQQV